MSDTAKLNYANHDVWRAEIEAMRYWVEKFGVDKEIGADNIFPHIVPALAKAKELSE